MVVAMEEAEAVGMEAAGVAAIWAAWAAAIGAVATLPVAASIVVPGLPAGGSITGTLSITGTS